MPFSILPLLLVELRDIDMPIGHGDTSLNCMRDCDAFLTTEQVSPSYQDVHLALGQSGTYFCDLQ